MTAPPRGGGSTLPVPPQLDSGLASMPAPIGEPTTSGPLFPPTLETAPPSSGLLLPPSLDTGRLGPSPRPSDTGQIPAVSATSLPPDLSWAAEDNEAPIGPPSSMLSSPLSAPSPLRPSTPPPPARLLAPSQSQPGRPTQHARHEGDPAAHVVAMSDAARTAVEATVGRAGGGPGGMPMAGATQEQVLSRGQLFRYLTSIRS
jgi:hypothetical protein